MNEQLTGYSPLREQNEFYESFMCRRLSYDQMHVGNIQQHQLLSPKEAAPYIEKALSSTKRLLIYCSLGWLALMPLLWFALTTIVGWYHLLILILFAALAVFTFRARDIYQAPNHYPTTIALHFYGINFLSRVNDSESIYHQSYQQSTSSYSIFSQEITFSWNWVTEVRYLDSVVTVLPDPVPFSVGGRAYEGAAVDLIFDPEKMPSEAKSRYFNECAALWASWPKPTIRLAGHEDMLALRIDLTALTPESEKERLLACIEKYVPAERIDFSLLKNNPDSLSHTELWLDDFSTSTKRKQLSLLPDGHKIAHGRYEILRTIGSGGQATVYLASRPDSKNKPSSASPPVVLKEFVLPIDAGAEVTKRALANVQQEAVLLQALDHPHIVRLIECLRDDHRAYLVLEYIEGETLRNLVSSQGACPQSLVVPLAMQMCQILSYLHSQNPPVIHRDFTPDNLMLTSGKEIKLIDFNVAQRLESTATRTVVGKHCYLPPEQFRGQSTPQSDLYALGATLFFLLTGREPIPLTCSNPSQFSNSVSEKLSDIVTKLTTLELTKRYLDVAAVQKDLESLALLAGTN